MKDVVFSQFAATSQHLSIRRNGIMDVAFSLIG